MTYHYNRILGSSNIQDKFSLMNILLLHLYKKKVNECILTDVILVQNGPVFEFKLYSFIDV